MIAFGFMLQQKEEAAADKLLVELENDFWKEMVPVGFCSIFLKRLCKKFDSSTPFC